MPVARHDPLRVYRFALEVGDLALALALRRALGPPHGGRPRRGTGPSPAALRALHALIVALGLGDHPR